MMMPKFFFSFKGTTHKSCNTILVAVTYNVLFGYRFYVY